MLLRLVSALPLALVLTLGMVWLMQALIEHRSIADELERPPLRLLYLATDDLAVEAETNAQEAQTEAPEPEPVLQPEPEPEPLAEPVPEAVPEPEPEPVVEPAIEPVPENNPQPEPEPVPENNPQPEPEPVPEPLPAQIPEPEPEPPRPQPTPKPPPKPAPRPVPQAKAAPAKAPAQAKASPLKGPPIFRPKPRYPEAARRKGTEGWVMVGFTVTRSGATSGISILSASPPGVFDQAAREAVGKWRYQAQPIDRPGQRARIQFRLR